MLKLGYKASAEQFGPTELLYFATIAETCRFDSVFISDHFQPWRHTHGHAPFSIAWLGAHKTRQATIYDRPAEMIPIYVAAAGPMVAKYAGRAGDGLICTSGKPMTLYRDTLLPNVEAGLAGSGRSSSAFDRVIEMKVSFDTEIERALNDTRHWAALALPAEEKMSIDDPLEMEKLADALPIETAASRWILSTDPDEHIEKIAAYIKMGFGHLVFHAPGNDQEGFLRLYTDQVMPKLRNLS